MPDILDYNVLILGANPLVGEALVGAILGDAWLEKQKVNAIQI